MKKNFKMPGSGSETPIRVAIYVRVSTVYQIDKDSLPMMKQDLTSYCKYILNTDDFVILRMPDIPERIPTVRHIRK